MCKDESLSLIKNANRGTCQGLDAWRSFSKEYDPINAVSNHRLLKRLTSPAQCSLENLKQAESNPKYTFVKGDIMDPVATRSTFEGVEVVVNFAAESHNDRGVLDPGIFVRTNVLGTQVLLESARQAGVQRFHHISTCEVFGDLSLDDSRAFLETDPFAPRTPYNASKASANHLVMAYYHTYGLPVSISHCCNNYGAYQFPEKLIPVMILNGLEDKALPVYGDGSNVRDWLFVDDHARALVLVATEGKTGETYNIGGNCEMKNIDVVHAICDILDELRPRSNNKSRRDLITYVTDRPGHDHRYAIDASKIKKELDFGPDETFKTGMRKTVLWYLDHTTWTQRVQSGDYKRERLGLEG